MADRDLMDRHPAAAARQARISPRLRAILDDRARRDEGPYEPIVLTRARIEVLRAIVALVVPHVIEGLDIARRIDVKLGEGSGVGWRAETLPTDAQAYAKGLDTLDAAAQAEGSPFATAPGDTQHALLTSIAAGTFVAPANSGFDAGQMKDWFDDLRSDAVRIYVAHPAAMAAIDYEGHANGAAGGAAFEGWSDRMIEDVR